MDWAQILVIILSVFLALFLALAVALVTLLIKVIRQIKNITTSAERAVVKLESTASNVSLYSSPVSLAKLARSFVKNYKKQ